MRLRLLFLSACLAGALVAAAPAPAIVDGELDGVTHPAVGLVRVPRLNPPPPPAPQSTVCTGTMLGPTVVLTAAHCFIGAIPTGSGSYFGLFTLANPASPASRFMLGTATIHPGFDAETTTGFTDDLAVINLVAPYPGATGFPTLPRLQVIPPGQAKRQAAEIVGYGLLGYSGGAPIGNGPPAFRYRKDISLLVGKQPNHVGLERSACNGDSGAPILVGSEIVAVTSFAIAPFCSGDALAYRLDTMAAQQFLMARGIDVPRGQQR